MAASKDYYEVLGVSRDADAKTIKRAFLKLARKVHPDVSDDPDAEKKFKDINEAYSVLSDETRRANYDRYGDPDGPGGFAGDYVDMSDLFNNFGVGDIFSSFFGGMGHGAAAQAQNTRGRDMGLTLQITLEEAARGCTKTVAYERLATCDDCNGSGVGAHGSVKQCSYCHGSGRRVIVQQTIFGAQQIQTMCSECGGTGQHIEGACDTCAGQGRAPSREKVQVDIPAGIHSGQSLRVSGRGEAGVRNKPSGDLLITIAIESHPQFKRQGDDLFYTLDIDAFEAMLGATCVIDGILPDEKITIEVPAGCQYGQQLVCARHGMPRLSSSARGSLIVTVTISIPRDLDAHVREALAAVQKSLSGEKDAVDGGDADSTGAPEKTNEADAAPDAADADATTSADTAPDKPTKKRSSSQPSKNSKKKRVSHTSRAKAASRSRKGHHK